MNKDGHIGIVSHTNKPISKMDPNQPIIRKNTLAHESDSMEMKLFKQVNSELLTKRENITPKVNQ